LIEEAKKVGEVSYFGNSKASYKLYNDLAATVFYFENPGPKTLQCNFTIVAVNLQLQGSEKGTNDFEILVPPGKTDYKILKPVVAGEETSFSMSSSFKLVANL
jgi:hypothetical protein